MKIFIFRTDIKTKKKIKIVKPFFNNHPGIIHWSIDTEDIDKVLKIEATDDVSEKEVIQLIKSANFYCEVLPD